jgi:hypothetical protein
VCDKYYFLEVSDESFGLIASPEKKLGISLQSDDKELLFKVKRSSVPR